MIIDSRGKLFGKVSIIDIVIVVVLLGAVAGIGYKFTKSKTVSPFVRADKLEIQFYGEEVPDFAAKAIKKGDLAKDSEKNVFLGTVKDIKIGKSVSWVESGSRGEYVASSKTGYSSIYITLEGKGVFGSTGVTINNAEYYVGQTVNLRVGNAAFYIKVSDIRKKE